MPVTWLHRPSEPGLWTVGFFDPQGYWQPNGGDFNSQDEAAARTAWLNGSPSAPVTPGDLAPAAEVLHRRLRRAAQIVGADYTKRPIQELLNQAADAIRDAGQVRREEIFDAIAAGIMGPGDYEVPFPIAEGWGRSTDNVVALLSRPAAEPAHDETCWLCRGLGGVAVHNDASEAFGKRLLVAHVPESKSHPVYPCPLLGVAAEPPNEDGPARAARMFADVQAEHAATWPSCHTAHGSSVDPSTVKGSAMAPAADSDAPCMLCGGDIADHVEETSEGPHGEEVHNYRCLIAELSDVIHDVETSIATDGENVEPGVEDGWVRILKLVETAYKARLGQ